MEKETKSFWRSFRFTTSRDQLLTERITEIEALATKQLRAGVSESAVLANAVALLNLACHGLQAGKTTALSRPAPRSAARPASQPAEDPLRHLQAIPTQLGQTPPRRHFQS